MLFTRKSGVRAFVAGCAVACGTALTGTTAEAAQIFTDRAAWETALGGATIVNETFPDTIDTAPVITFASGVVSTGTSTIDFVDVLGDDVFNQYDFLGVIGDAAFDSVVFTNSDHPTIENVAFLARFLSFTTGAVGVPGPATLLLLLAALAALGVAARRRVAWWHVV